MSMPHHAHTSSKTRQDQMNWSHRLLHDRRLLLLIILVVFVAGMSSAVVLPRMEDPILAKRAAIINTLLPGADATRVEALLTEKIEEQLREIEEIKELRSESRAGISTITVELLDSITRPDEVWSRVRGKIEDLLPQLPTQASRPEFEELDVRAFARIVSVVWLANSPPDYSVLRRAARKLQDRLQAVAGTESIQRFGDPGEEVLVRVDPSRAAALGLSTENIAAQLAALDAKDAAGILRGPRLNLAVQLGNQFLHLEDVKRADIQGANGRFVPLEQIADVSLETPRPLPRQARHRELPAIALGVLVRSETRIDWWSEKADAAIARFEQELPAGLGIREVMDQNEYVQRRLYALVASLALGAAAVCAVILFMMGWRSAVVVAMALPLTVFTVLFGMRVMQIPIHQMSVTGLIIALGLLIDNAIVVADEVRGELASHGSPVTAVSSVWRRLAVPLLGSTLTTAFAFAPIALMPGPAGEFVGSIASSVILAISASLVFSLTLINATGAMFIRVPCVTANAASNRRGFAGLLAIFRHGFASERLESRYRRCLTALFSHPKISIATAMILPLVGIAGGAFLPEQFFPAADRDQFHIEIELEPGASTASTLDIARRVDKILQQEPIDQIDWFFGESAPPFYYNLIPNRKQAANFGHAIVHMREAREVVPLIRRLQRKLDGEIAEARILVRQLEQGPPFDAPVEIRLFGPDLEELISLGNQIRAMLTHVPQVTHTRSLLGETLPKATLVIDSQSASLAELTPRQIADQVQMALDGRLGGALLQETEELPVRVRTDDASRSEVAGLRSLELVSPARAASADRHEIPPATLVPLRAISQFRLEPRPGVIVRLNRLRMNEISGYLVADTLPSLALRDFRQRLADSGFTLPAGYGLTYGGEESKRDDAIGNLMANVGVLAALMVATLVLALSSFRLAGIIGAVGFLSVGLGLLSILLAGYPFGFMAIIGTMGLIGVAINDSIVVIAALREQHTDHTTTPEEIAKTVSGCTRHVIATTLTTIAGFAPLILSGGKFWPPLAVSIAGGVTGATLLALIFTPSAYRVIYIRREWECPQTSVPEIDA